MENNVTEKTEAQQLLDLLKEETKYSQAFQDYAWVDSEGDGFKTVSREEGYQGRWDKQVTLVTQAPSGKFYQWGYAEGLTEYQEDSFDDTELPVEVERKVRVIEEEYWEKVA